MSLENQSPCLKYVGISTEALFKGRHFFPPIGGKMIIFPPIFETELSQRVFKI